MKKIAVFLVTLCVSFSIDAETFHISPANPVLEGNKMTIQLKGLPANASVKIVAERAQKSWGSDKSLLYRSEAVFVADAMGEIDLSTTPAMARSGTYKGADIRGLFWSMMPTKTEAVRDANKDVKTGVVNLVASVEDKTVATAKFEFIQYAPQLTIEKLDKFPGAILASLPNDAKTTATTKRPAVIVLGGSEGGNEMVNDATKRIASQGFAAMSLPYYSPKSWPTMKQEVPELPMNFVDIDISRINEARNYLRSRADIDGERIAIYGVSKGAEYVLLAAVTYPWVKSVVAVVPTDVVWEGWGEGVAPNTRASFALNGKPFAFTPYQDFGQEFMGFQTGEEVRIRRPQDKGRAANPERAAAARIPIERYQGALMLIGGQEDQVWNSGMMAHNLAERRAEASKTNKAKGETVSLIYTDAGHYLSGNGYGPTTQYNAGPSKSGGTPEGNAKAQADAWPKTIQFLKRSLAVK
jgi:dienelactone hydrolase